MAEGVGVHRWGRLATNLSDDDVRKMRPWFGGDAPPADYALGPLLCRNGFVPPLYFIAFRHNPRRPGFDIIAYTPVEGTTPNG